MRSDRETDTRIEITDRTGEKESRMRTILAVLMAMTLCAGAGRAWAQDAAGKAAAEQMFQEGRRLMQETRYEEAIAKFQASFELDPGSGAQGNIALCYERMGKLASAWGHYRETAARAKREGNAERARVALQRATALEPRLPRLRIRLSTQHKVDLPADLAIERNGMPVPEALLDTAVYVDPGQYRVVATAPGRSPFSATVRLGVAEERTVEIPVLAPVAEPATRTSTSPADDRNPGVPLTGATTPGAEPGRGRRVAGLITGGAGLAVLAVGIGVGANATALWDEAFESGACNAMTLMCTPDGQAQTDDARTRARASNVLFGAGVVAIAAGAILYFTAPRASSQRAARLVPFTADDTFGMAMIGGF
jgi:hypothetical protein